MTKAKGRRQIEQRVVDIDDSPDDDPSVWVPDLAGAFEHRYPCPIDHKNRFEIRQMLCDGRLQGFAIVHLTLYGGQWREVARADCAHGTVHVDLLHRRRKTKHVRTLRVINSERDLDEGFTEAWADLEDNLDEHLRRWKA